MSKSFLADDREDYVFGALVKGATKLAKSAGKGLLNKTEQTAIKNSKKYKQTVKELTTDNAQGAGVVYTKAEIKALEKDSPADANFEMFNEFLMSKKTHDRQANELIDAGIKPASVKRILSSDIEDKDLTEGERSIRNKFMNKYFSKEEELDIGLGPVKKEPILIEHEAGKEPKAIGGLMNQSLFDSQDFNKDTGFPSVSSAAPVSAPKESSITAERGSPTTDFPGDQMKKSLIADERQPYAEGSLMVPPEMESDMPVDTYPNIPPEEMDEAMESQLPDAEMEDKHMEFVFEESLDDEEQSYLMNALEADPKLSQIFDKVLTTASEFTGAGEVDGPGTGVSDSIPARLSDGEFVFTKKATDQMGSANLQAMMDDAERAYDGGMMREPAQEGGLLLYKGKDEDPLAYEKIAQDEIKKNMLRSNRAPSLNPG